MNYLNDAESFAKDLSEAADTQDWNRYRDIQAQLAAETAQAILAQASQAEMGKREAVRSVSERCADFDAFYGSDDYRQVLSQNKSLAKAILIAESNSSVQDSLVDLYSLAWNCYRADTPKAVQHSLRDETTPSALTEDQIFRATEQSKRVDLSAKKRQSLISQLEERGVLDQEF